MTRALEFAHALRRCGAMLLLPMLLCGPAAAQTAIETVGVTAGGTITYVFRICSTCDTPSDTVADEFKHRPGSRGPVIVSQHVNLGTAVADAYARALIVGSDAVPQLSAKASATPGIGLHAGFIGQGAYLPGATAFALAVQHYQYTGGTVQEYVLGYSLKGFAMSEGNPPIEADVQVNGGLSIHDGKEPNLELPLGGLVDISQRSVNGSAHSFNENGAVAITLNPGESFYLSSFLSANVSQGGWGMADASHTLDVAFTAGDTSQLVPLLTPVPEPTTWALWLLGLAGAGMRRRLRGR